MIKKLEESQTKGDSLLASYACKITMSNLARIKQKFMRDMEKTGPSDRCIQLLSAYHKRTTFYPGKDLQTC